MRRLWLIGLIVLTGTLARLAVAGDDEVAKPERRTITPHDYGRFERLGASAIAPDGRWFAYAISRVDEERELRLHHLATGDEEVFEHASRPTFSDDGSWFAYSIGVSAKEREKAEDSGEPIKPKLGVRNLVTGDDSEVKDIDSFEFSDDGRWLLMRKAGGGDGATVILRDLATGIDTTFGHVGAWAWADDNSMLAMTIAAPDDIGNGIQVFDPATRILRTLDSADATYRGLTWREDADDLAVMREIAYEDDEDVSHAVLTWRGLSEAEPTAATLDPSEGEHFPDGFRVVEYAGITWADDGAGVFFGCQAWVNRPAAVDADAVTGTDTDTDTDADTDADADADADTDAGTDADTVADTVADTDEDTPTLRDGLVDDPSNVEVWHSDDVDIQPLQKRREQRDRRDSFLASWRLDGDDIVMLGSELTEDTILMDAQRHAIGLDNTPHERARMFGPTLYDVYVIDVVTGEREQILEKLKFNYGSSPDGRHFLYQRDGHLWVYDVPEDRHRNLTGAIDAQFVNQEITALTDEKPAYGVGGWAADGSAVLLYDRFDMWWVPADGSDAARLTRGADARVRHRRVVLDPDDDEFVPIDRAMFVSTFADRTKRSGYASLKIGGRIKSLVNLDARVDRLAKAGDADVFAYVIQRHDESPRVVISGPDLDDDRVLVRTNAFIADEFLRGRGEIIDYENVHGQSLQGAIYYPDDYDPNRRYPMIVYIYERLSDGLHRFQTPSERSAYSTAVWTAEGYFVYQPDIVYRPQNPGLSAVECLQPAVEAAVATGKIDADRIGLVGHSWGAYQTAFLVTQTDVFAAGIAGAPLTNMMSMSMSIYWNSGQTDAWIFHESQGRMDKPFWRDVDTYIANSPIFSIDDMDTPLLIAFGDEDGAVDWNQGVEMYNAARLADKHLVMLVYPGENHGLRDKANQVDYHYRILEWFGHYLKGDDAPAWITEGKPHLERQREIEKAKADDD